jgi:hypothetical protein
MIIVDDNFLTKEEVLFLQKQMYLDQPSGFPWFFQKNSVFQPQELEDEAFNNNSQFVHEAQFLEKIHSPLATHATNILNKFCKKHNILVSEIIRIKANLVLNESRPWVPQVNAPHVDLGPSMPLPDNSNKHYVFLYYVNNSDGPTTIYNEAPLPSNEKYTLDNLTVLEEILPAEGKAVFFEGSQVHSSSTPRMSDFRCVININVFGNMGSI